jgi:hypothetical protein
MPTTICCWIFLVPPVMCSNAHAAMVFQLASDRLHRPTFTGFGLIKRPHRAEPSSSLTSVGLRRVHNQQPRYVGFPFSCISFVLFLALFYFPVLFYFMLLLVIMLWLLWFVWIPFGPDLCVMDVYVYPGLQVEEDEWSRLLCCG